MLYFPLRQQVRNYLTFFKYGLPRWHKGKGSACQCRRHKRYRFNPWVWKILWSRKWHPFQYSCLENFMDRGAWWATVHGITKCWTWLSVHAYVYMHTHTHSCIYLFIQQILNSWYVWVTGETMVNKTEKGPTFKELTLSWETKTWTKIQCKTIIGCNVQCVK